MTLIETLSHVLEETAVALRDTLQGYQPQELSDSPDAILRRVVAALRATNTLSDEDLRSLETTLLGERQA